MASIPSQSIQGKVNAMFDQWLKTSTGADSARGSAVSKREANELLKAAGTLSRGDVDALRKAFVAGLEANKFQVAADARQLFADFFKIPPESIPVSSTRRTGVQSAQVTRIKNESDTRVKVTAKETRDLNKHGAQLPPNLKQMVGESLMNALQNNGLKLDPEARSQITRFVAQSGAGQQPLSMEDGRKLAKDLGRGADALGKLAKEGVVNAGRMVMADMVNTVEGNGGLSALDRALSLGARPMSYAQYVMANGGSFEEILFAFLMELADKADKKLMEKMKAMERKERIQASDSSKAEARIKQVLGEDSGMPGTGAGAGDGQGGGQVRKVSQQLEGMVQSVHAMVQADSVGGVQITTEEATRLVDRLKSLPPNVQSMLAGSISTAMKARGLPLQQEAFDAIVGWGKGVLGKKFDVGSLDAAKAGAAAMPLMPDSGLAQALSQSTKLEDKLAGFIVDTLTSDTMSLKDKFEPFKSMRAQIDAEMGPQSQQALPTLPEEPRATKGARKKNAPEAQAAAAPRAAAPIVAENPQGATDGAMDTAATESTSETHDQNELQRLMQERSRIFEMLSNIMKALNDMIMTSVRNMR